MEATIYLREASQASDILRNIRDELTNAIRTALIAHAYNTDVQLSFGLVHINDKGSVSQISFNGSDVTDIDAFIVKQAFQLDEDHYFDIRNTIKQSPDFFHFYPIQIGTKVSLTVLKTSPFFTHRYGSCVSNTEFRVEYASKYVIIYRDVHASPDVYCVGLFDPISTANTLLEKAGKTLGGKRTIYYCFVNTRPEIFLHLGQIKSDFAGYHPEKNPDMYNFYRGSVISGVFRFNKKTDSNGKVKVKETRRICLQLIIKMQYGTVDKFCEMHEIDQMYMTAYLSGADSTVRHTNGDAVTPTRLEEILNLPFSPDADQLKDKNLLIKVSFDEIPAA